MFELELKSYNVFFHSDSILSLKIRGAGTQGSVAETTRFIVHLSCESRVRLLVLLVKQADKVEERFYVPLIFLAKVTKYSRTV